jgi:tetratricopeptide (TPR) repeat protein
MSFNRLFSGLIAALLLAGGMGCATAVPPGANASDSAAYYTQLLVDLPDDSSIYYNRGICYFRLGKYSEAISDFSNLLRLYPGYYRAHKPRADCHRLLGNYQLAIAGYDSALAYTGGDAYVYNARGYCNFRLEQFDAAAFDYSAVIRSDSTNADAYLRRGIAYYKDSAFLSAVPDLQRTVALAPDSGMGYLWLGNALFMLGSYDDAISAYLLAKKKGAPLTEENHIAKAYYRRAKNLESSNEQQAILDLNESIAADSAFGQSYFLRGKLLSRLELNEQACPDFSKAATLGVLEAFPEAKRTCDPVNW